MGRGEESSHCWLGMGQGQEGKPWTQYCCHFLLSPPYFKLFS